MAFGTAQAAGHDFPPLRVRLPAPYWLTAGASLTLSHSLSRLPGCLTYTLFAVCRRYTSASPFVIKLSASAAARHVSEREQAQDQDEDGDREKDAVRHRTLDPADALGRANTPKCSQPQLLRPARKPVPGFDVGANKVTRACAAVASRATRAEAQGLPEYAAVGKQR